MVDVNIETRKDIKKETLDMKIARKAVLLAGSNKIHFDHVYAEINRNWN